MSSDKNTSLNLKEQTHNQYQKQQNVRNMVQNTINMNRIPGENILNHVFYFGIKKFI